MRKFPIVLLFLSPDTLYTYTYCLVVGTRRKDKTKTSQEDFTDAGGSSENVKIAGLRRSDNWRWCNRSRMRSGRLHARYIAAWSVRSTNSTLSDLKFFFVFFLRRFEDRTGRGRRLRLWHFLPQHKVNSWRRTVFTEGDYAVGRWTV